MPRNYYGRGGAATHAISRDVPEVVETGVTGAERQQPASRSLKKDQRTQATNGTIRLPENGRTQGKLQRRQPLLNSHKTRARATTKKTGKPKCSESEWQILAEAAVDISEILLGEGIHKINSWEDRMKMAVKKAEAIRKVVDHGEYDRLLREFPANVLPKITPGALLKWLDGEFKDVLDAVFFVDSPEEFAKLLQTFSQGIANNFFGDKVRVTVKVNGTVRGKKQIAASSEARRTLDPDPAKLAAQPSLPAAQSESPVVL